MAGFKNSSGCRSSVNPIRFNRLLIGKNESCVMRAIYMTHEDTVILIFLLIAVLMGGIMVVGVVVLMRRNPNKKE